MDEAPRSKKYILKGIPQALVLRRSDDTHGWNNHKEIKLLTDIELAYQHDDKPLFTGSLRLEAYFYFPTPSPTKSSRKAKSGDMYLFKPSLFLLINFVENAACGIIYFDEASITDVIGKKLYADTPRTEFTITEIHGKKENSRKSK